jgi:hypothetical protein
MSNPFALQPAPAHADHARWRTLVAEGDRREADLVALQIDLQKLQTRYLDEIGALYRQLDELERAIADAEIRAGLRPPAPEAADDGDDHEPAAKDGEAMMSCSNRGRPSDDLRRMFRDIAKAIHPDRALDERTRYRRHSLMAEANRAYAERDADRLRLILRRWRQSPDAFADDLPGDDGRGMARRIAAAEERIADLDAALADLRRTAIYRLKTKIDETKTQGWDLFSEMVLQVKSEIGRAKARLVVVRRQTPGG